MEHLLRKKFSARGFALLEVLVAIAILLPAVFLLSAFLHRMESRLADASSALCIPAIGRCVEDFIGHYGDRPLPVKMQLEKLPDQTFRLIPTVESAPSPSYVQFFMDRESPMVHCEIITGALHCAIAIARNSQPSSVNNPQP
jgi:prepilin-type N-terminal cleavage/methylation domain-containing protein